MSGISHNDADHLIAMSKTAQGPRLNDIRLALNELVQQEQAAWADGLVS